jgi:E3 ubiquitin-protein ligase SHPRH
MVRDELGIPEQTRYLVPVELGRVEKHVSAPPSSPCRSDGMSFEFYDRHMEQALLALGFDARGVTIDKKLLDPVLLRSWIRKLRGICTHPQVGQLQNSADKGAFKSIEEVLEVSTFLGLLLRSW